jgi:predicted secreted protein
VSLPTEFDFALIKMGDGAIPEVFTTVCGLQDATVNRTVNTQDRFVRDCAKPGEVPERRVKATGRQTDISGTGLTNATEVDRVEAALGVVKNYKIEAYQDDGTDTSTLLGTWAGPFMLSAANNTIPRESNAAFELTLVSDGAVAWTEAP